MPPSDPRRAALLPLFAFLAACSATPDAETNASNDAGAGAQAASAATPRDACSLITKQEADSILGAPVEPTPRSGSGQRSVCDYMPVGGAAAKSFQSFSLDAYWTGGQQEMEVARRGVKAAGGLAGGLQDSVVSETMGLRPVEGLGDEAYYSGRVMSYVRKADALLVFDTRMLEGPVRERWEALSRAALKRL